MALRTVYKYLSAEAVSKKKEMPCIEEIGLLGWVGIFIFYLLNNRGFAVEVWMFTFLFLWMFWKVKYLMFYFIWLQWEANQKTRKNIHKNIQHLDFSFLTSITNTELMH